MGGSKVRLPVTGTLFVNIVEEKLFHAFEIFDRSSQLESNFLIHFDKNKGWNVWIILRTRRQYTVRSVEACAHPGWQDEAELKSEKSICNWSFYQRERERKEHTERERERYRERERESVCMRASDRDIETELERERETERQRGRERKRERKRERERKRDKNNGKQCHRKKEFQRIDKFNCVLFFNLDKTVGCRGTISPNAFWWIEQWNVFIVTDNTKKSRDKKKLPFRTLWSPFAWELWNGRKSFEIVQPVHYHSQRVQTFFFKVFN